MPTTTASYGLGPFSLISEIPLPELPAGRPAGIPVSVVLGSVPGEIPSPTFASEFCTASPQDLLLHIKNVASYYIHAGREVIVQPCANGNALDIRGYLLSNIFAILCHQLRLLPLHASAVKIGNGTVAFLGNSGAGKSTLAAFLVARGFPLVADDICLLDPDAPPQSRVLPVAPWVKLWRTSLDALGQPQDGLTRTFMDEDKYRVPAENLTKVEVQPLSLRGLVFLKRLEDDTSAPGLQSMGAAHSVVEAMRYTYQQYLLDWLGLQEQHFTRCSQAISGAHAVTLSRPWGFAGLEEVANLLQDYFGSPVALVDEY